MTNPLDRALIYFVIAVLTGLCVAYALLLTSARPAKAEDRVRIPVECAEIAQRFGIPSDLSPKDAARAKSALRKLALDFPGARECRIALNSEKR